MNKNKHHGVDRPDQYTFLVNKNKHHGVDRPDESNIVWMGFRKSSFKNLMSIHRLLWSVDRIINSRAIQQ